MYSCERLVIARKWSLQPNFSMDLWEQGNFKVLLGTFL